ncbi:hypothetical protein F8C76_11190 [Flagellimonas olearia]|uniref:DUF4280 domain-containing protein n=1 Tax=Flagellimonas olearia TaxID=552546 RepID=A0A6I1DX69_9FLAO|nr:hypothetical protein [Allomuricauda olearia]KAB7528421.1 hypothetical protein F8C76_11190 [Allomuricauda olearia]
MKNILYCSMALWCSLCLNAQDFSPKQQQRLDHLGLNYAYLMAQSEANERQLWKILDMDRKRKNNLVMGGSFAGLGALLITCGALVVAKDYPCDDSHVCENTGQVIVGGSLIALGTFDVSVSLPLFLSSFKRKNIRNKMIKNLKAQYPNQPELMPFEPN